MWFVIATEISQPQFRLRHIAIGKIEIDRLVVAIIGGQAGSLKGLRQNARITALRDVQPAFQNRHHEGKIAFALQIGERAVGLHPLLAAKGVGEDQKRAVAIGLLRGLRGLRGLHCRKGICKTAFADGCVQQIAGRRLAIGAARKQPGIAFQRIITATGNLLPLCVPVNVACLLRRMGRRGQREQCGNRKGLTYSDNWGHLRPRASPS